jgi:protein-disulfide isomerase
MSSALRNSVIVLCAAALAGFSAMQVRKAEQKPAQPAPAASKSQPAQAPKKSALDRATLESYVRHLFVWGPQISVEVADPKPSKELPGFQAVTVHASAGGASQDEEFLVSKDGQKILKAMVFDVNQNPFKADLDKLNTQFSPSFGTPGAPVVIVVFTDFECPFCKEEAKMLRENLLSAYPKQVRVYFKDFPLEQIHPWAKMASIAGRCIFRQNAGAFWKYHDWVYEHQAELTPANFKEQVLEWAKGSQIDTLQLTRCLDTRSTAGEVDKSIAEGKALNINSTPTMFVNGRRLVGQVAWPNLREIIDYEIGYQKTAHNAGEDCGCEVSLSPVSK